MIRAFPLFAAAVVFAGFAAAQADAVRQHLEAGVRATESGDTVTALAELQSAVRLDPACAACEYRLGLLFAQLRNFSSAQAAFHRAIQLKTDFAEAWYGLGLTYIADPQTRLDWPSAIGAFRNATKTRPDYPEALNMLGAGLDATGDSQGAMREFEAAVKANPKLAEAHLNVALALDKSDQMDRAEKEYRLAIAARGAYPEASTALGKLLFRENHAAAAEAELRLALRINPDLNDAHYALARVVQAENKTSDATTEFEITNDLAQRKSDAMKSSRLSNQALEVAAAGDFAAAGRRLRGALALRPDSGSAHYNLGLILADSGDLPGAARELLNATSLLPGQARPWFELGRVFELSGDPDRALQTLYVAAKLAPGDERIAAERRKAEVTASKASPSASAPCEPQPDTAVAHLATGRKKVANGDDPGAAGEFLRALSLAPANTGARLELARAYARLGEMNRAKLEYLKLLAVDPALPEARTALDKLLSAPATTKGK